MPNAPRPENPARAVRVEDDLWQLALDRAARDGVTVSEVVRRALSQYVEES